MYKKRNLIFGCLATLIASVLFRFIGILNVYTFIGILVFFFVPTLFSSDFNDKR